MFVGTYHSRRYVLGGAAKTIYAPADLALFCLCNAGLAEGWRVLLVELITVSVSVVGLVLHFYEGALIHSIVFLIVKRASCAEIELILIEDFISIIPCWIFRRELLRAKRSGSVGLSCAAGILLTHGVARKAK